VYSGHVQAVFAEVEIPELCLVMCPNHTGVAVPWRSLACAWETPLAMSLLTTILPAILNGAARCYRKIRRPSSEHAVEVSPVPANTQPISVRPIAVHGQFERSNTWGGNSDVVAAHRGPVLIVASST